MRVKWRINSEEERGAVDFLLYEFRNTAVQLHDYAMYDYDWERFLVHYYVANYLNRNGVRTLVDFCSGEGVLLYALQRWARCLELYVAVDIDRRKLERLGARWGLRQYGRWRFKIEKYNVSVHEASRHISRAFDAVTYLFSIEHLRKDLAIQSLHEAYKLLRRGGHLLITFPNTNELKRADLTAWSCSEALDALDAAGFRVQEVRGLTGAAKHVPPALKRYGCVIPRGILKLMYYWDRPELSTEILIIARK